MNALPLPPAERVRQMRRGQRRSRVIRDLYAERATVGEIAEYLRVPADEVRRTLLRPVTNGK